MPEDVDWGETVTAQAVDYAGNTKRAFRGFSSPPRRFLMQRILLHGGCEPMPEGEAVRDCRPGRL